MSILRKGHLLLLLWHDWLPLWKESQKQNATNLFTSSKSFYYLFSFLCLSLHSTPPFSVSVSLFIQHLLWTKFKLQCHFLTDSFYSTILFVGVYIYIYIYIYIWLWPSLTCPFHQTYLCFQLPDINKFAPSNFASS